MDVIIQLEEVTINKNGTIEFGKEQYVISTRMHVTNIDNSKGSIFNIENKHYWAMIVRGEQLRRTRQSELLQDQLKEE